MHISVAKDFNSAPAGRHVSDGPYSGEQFRKRWLEPPLLKGEQVLIDLDGTEGYGSSFLEEAFGGLVRETSLRVDDIKRLLRLRSDDSSLLEEIWEYIDDAEEIRRRGKRA